VVTLVYCGGEIVTSLEASYADLVEEEYAPEGEIRRLMSDQHQELIHDIRRGRFNPPQMPFGHDLITNHSLDELVLGYLEDSITEVERAEAAEREIKVGRVLNRLGQFLSAAQRAELERQARSVPAEVEEKEEIAESTETVIEDTSIDADLVSPTDVGPRRTRPWVWAVAAIAIVLGLVGVLALLDPGKGAATPPVETSRLAPSLGSTERATEESTPVRAGVSSSPALPSPVAEPITELPTVDDEATVRVEAAVVPAPVIPEEKAEPAARVAAPTPRKIENTTEPRAPASPPAIVETTVEDDPLVTPEDTTAAPIPSEPILPPEVTDPSAPLDEVVVEPQPRQRDLPRYTRRARRLQQEGVVQLRILIDAQGEVAEVLMLSGIPDSDLNDAAIDVAHEWTFSPARKEGQHVEFWKDVAFEFTIRPDRTTSVKIRE
jgi:TonB family protein